MPQSNQQLVRGSSRTICSSTHHEETQQRTQKSTSKPTFEDTFDDCEDSKKTGYAALQAITLRRQIALSTHVSETSKDTHVQKDSTKNDEKVEEDEEDEEENSTSDSDKEQEDVDVNKWQAAIMQFAPDDAYDNNDESNEGLPVDEREQTTPVSEYIVDYYVNHLPPERCCEEVWTSPAPLPDDNEPDYPQENKAYFATKKEQNYVRNDRVTLERITSLAGLLEEGEHSGLPTLRSVYQDNVEVIREGW